MFKKIPYEKNDKKELTDAEIEAFKKEFDGVYLIEVEDKKCYLHTPTRVMLDAANAASAKARSKFSEIIIKSTWLAGDKEILTDDAYFLAAASTLDDIIEYKDASLKKL